MTYMKKFNSLFKETFWLNENLNAIDKYIGVISEYKKWNKDFFQYWYILYWYKKYCIINVVIFILQAVERD